MLFYKGTKTSGYIQPRDLSNYDIVVTTYSILQSETNYVDLPHSNSEEGEFLKLKNLVYQITWGVVHKLRLKEEGGR